jgi:zona occludens toxin (predicted ATPase)
MIHLITGLPGSGKTLNAIARGIELKAQGRRVYALDVNGLDEAVTGFERYPGTFEQWDEFLYPGDVLIVDEVQRYLPAVVRRDAVPAWIERLTRNRHDGVDLIMVTQHPKLLDSFVRRLVNEHHHLINVFGKPEANLYTWTQVCEEPESKSQRLTADVVRWKYPENVYAMYKSAEAHTREEKVPRMVKFGKLALVACLLFMVIAVGILWRMYHASGAAGARSATPPAKSASALSDMMGPRVSARAEQPPLSAKEWIERQIPRFGGMPWSAPIFDDRKAVAEPEIYCAAMTDEKRCICHTEQGTRLQVAFQQCLTIATVGVYNPYRKPRQVMPGAGTGADASAPTHVDRAPSSSALRSSPSAPST